MGEPANRLTDGERAVLVAQLVSANAEDLKGYILVAITDDAECDHHHVRVTRRGSLSKNQELRALMQAVDILYDH